MSVLRVKNNDELWVNWIKYEMQKYEYINLKKEYILLQE